MAPLSLRGGAYPTPETVKKVYEELDRQRATQLYLDLFPALSVHGILKGQVRDLGVRSSSDIMVTPYLRLWPREIKAPREGVNYAVLMFEPGDGAVTRASRLARTALDPGIPRHRFSDFPLDYSVMFCEDHSALTGNITFQDNLLHILLSR